MLWPVIADASFQLVEHGENVGERFFVSYLRGGEAGAVNTVVQLRVDLRVEGVDVDHLKCTRRGDDFCEFKVTWVRGIKSAGAPT